LLAVRGGGGGDGGGEGRAECGGQYYSSDRIKKINK